MPTLTSCYLVFIPSFSRANNEGSSVRYSRTQSSPRLHSSLRSEENKKSSTQGKRFAANVICFRFFGFVVQKGRGRGGDRLGRPIECATAERAGPGAALAARLPPPPPAHVARHRGLLQLHGLLPIGPYQTRTNKKKLFFLIFFLAGGPFCCT